MAACLRSDRSPADCRQEMMQSCKSVMGEGGCGMGMMDGRRGHHDHPASPSSTTKP